MNWQNFKTNDEINNYTILCNAKKLEYTFQDDTILFIDKRNGVWHVDMHDPYTCTNCWDEPKVFDNFDALLDYIVELQKNELESYIDALNKFAQVQVKWHEYKMCATVLEGIEIRR